MHKNSLGGAAAPRPQACVPEGASREVRPRPGWILRSAAGYL